MPKFKPNTSPVMKRSGFKMKGYTYPGESPMRKEKDKKEKSASAKQTEVDLKNIEASSSQPVGGITTGDYKETVKSVKRQNRLNTRNMSKSEIKEELKKRKKEGVNVSEKLDVGFLGRVFGSKKKLASKLSHQRNVSDI